MIIVALFYLSCAGFVVCVIMGIASLVRRRRLLKQARNL